MLMRALIIEIKTSIKKYMYICSKQHSMILVSSNYKYAESGKSQEKGKK
jgi:hypothetical protein